VLELDLEAEIVKVKLPGEGAIEHAQNWDSLEVARPFQDRAARIPVTEPGHPRNSLQ
jgi:hypothetical protein